MKIKLTLNVTFVSGTDEMRRRNDLPVTTIERTLVDLSRSADPSLIRASDAA
jgi:hypothetical protein